MSTTLAETAVESLGAATLAGIVDSIASRPAGWQPLVVDATDERAARLLLRDDEVEVWVISWGPAHDTGLHDHGASAAAFAVVEGELVEQRLGPDGPRSRHLTPDAAASTVPAGVLHRVHNSPAGTRAASIHAYSPPLRELGNYRVAHDGTLERVAQSSEIMLVPLDPAAPDIARGGRR